VPVYLRKLAGYYSNYYFWFRIELLVVGLLVLLAMAYALAQLGANREQVRGPGDLS